MFDNDPARGPFEREYIKECIRKDFFYFRLDLKKTSRR